MTEEIILDWDEDPMDSALDLCANCKEPITETGDDGQIRFREACKCGPIH